MLLALDWATDGGRPGRDDGSPWARDKPLRAGGATAYVCNRGARKLPTNDPKVFAAQLAETTAYP